MVRLTSVLVFSLLAIAVSCACTLGTATGCSTSVANGLTSQLVAELNSMGYNFTTLSGAPYNQNIHCTDPCQPYLQAPAADSLLQAAQAKGDYITLNSAYRSSAQQYLLYEWYITGQCGVGLAAKPGQSDHEAGRSIDTSYYSYWMSTLLNYGWAWSYGYSDPYHFDYFIGTASLAPQSLQAFQLLWNKNNPTAQIDVDGYYGPATANALSQAPCNGW